MPEGGALAQAIHKPNTAEAFDLGGNVGEHKSVRQRPEDNHNDAVPRANVSVAHAAQGGHLQGATRGVFQGILLGTLTGN